MRDVRPIVMGWHHVRFRTFCHATEDRERVLRALLTVSGEAPVSEVVAEGEHGNRVLILEATLGSRAASDAFWARVLADAALREAFARECEARVDEACVLHFRFDKQAAYEGRLLPALGDDIVKLEAKGRVFPAKPAKMVGELARFFATAPPP